MKPEARSELLKKMSINGFAIEDQGDTLTLRPRGMEATAAIIIKEVEENAWRVTGAFGNYAPFARGKKREYFETYITQWTQEALLQAPG